MLMKVDEVLMLVICNSFGQERSVYGAYHLLKGKKSAQTIQDGHFFAALPYFGLLKHLKREEINDIIHSFEERGMAKRLADDRIEITEKGRKRIEEYFEQRTYLMYLQGWSYDYLAKIFWQRFTLYIQTLTHVHEQSFQFYPVSHNKSIQRWVKQTLPSTKGERAEQLVELYKECETFLLTCYKEQAQSFVLQLSGVTQIGHTLLQVARILNRPFDEVRIMHIACIHQLLATVTEEEDKFPRLSMFTKDLTKAATLTESTKATLDYLKRGLTVDQIAAKRKLKKATIEDHIVELALEEEKFSIDHYVGLNEQEEILQAAEQLNTHKLREIKLLVNEQISYFMIRLTLAKRRL
ncbi:helix-turn-helix domain-containing protein [Bacillus solitudinis]|uniref:helix-turn-helix domain-containing protein n=1 Tax=Bacillus solitudinis TaxID=2014074 RepID=UPI000C232955|nr:helix-turn-helix domain-containing protein [Bacillus solitudinis]